MGECAVPDCSKPAPGDRRGGPGLCTAHAHRLRRYGDPLAGGPPRVRNAPGALCSVEGCAKAPKKRGMCDTHYVRWWKRGDAGGAELEEPGPKTLAYEGAHVRVRYFRGKAKDYTCVDCGGAAQEWSLKRDAVDLRVDDKGRAFSGDVADYDPRCRIDHRKYDRRP